MITVKDLAKTYIDGLKQALDFIPLNRLEELVTSLLRAYDNGNSVFIMGNGGSAATASHFACDINKGVCFGLSKRMKVICLNDNVPAVLAYANDLSYDDVFVEQLRNFLDDGDLVIGISGSGNSPNVIKAVEYANRNNAVSAAMTGFTGGMLSKAAKISVVVPVNDMQKAEDVHMILVHMIMRIMYERLHASNDAITLQELISEDATQYVRSVHSAEI
jgi:D-sedoheptulose 7-phosphate isomerase